MHYDEKQKILEAISLTQRYEVLLGMLLQQIEVLAIKKDFQKKCRNVSKSIRKNMYFVNKWL